MTAKRPSPRSPDAVLRAHALSYPEASEDFPWGERVVKVRGKVFAFLGRPEEGGLGLSVKLPGSATLALDLPFASPTGYGLGKSGWVTARFSPRERPPVELLKRWIDESYRAVAPKTLVAGLSGGGRGAKARGQPPTDAELKRRLGAAHAAYRGLLASLPRLEQEWKLYSKKAGFTLRLKEGERTLLYVQPQDGDFRAVVVLGERAAKAALASRLPSRLRKAIEAARPYVEGRSVSVTVRGAPDLRDVGSLLSFKRA
jgi:predicted DNA-binding protein (MmcQ/YjbR family)